MVLIQGTNGTQPIRHAEWVLTISTIHRQRIASSSGERIAE
jgi:hypothetical protein